MTRHDERSAADLLGQRIAAPRPPIARAPRRRRPPSLLRRVWLRAVGILSGHGEAK